MKKIYTVRKNFLCSKEQEVKLKKAAKELQKREGEFIRILIDNYDVSKISLESGKRTAKV